jgi:alpha-beta hydrolase superfamily lysophospholipase
MTSFRCHAPRAAALLALLVAGAVPAAAQRVAKAPPLPRSDTSYWAVVLNADTLATETVIRTPSRLEGELRLRRPRPMALQYVMVLRPDGTVDSVQTTTVDADVVARGTIVIRGDSATLTMAAPGLTAPRTDRVAVPPATLPFINLSAGALDVIFRRARAAGGDTVAIPLLAGPQLIPARVRFIGADSALLDVGVQLRSAVAPDGAFGGAVVPSQGVRFIRLTARPAAGPAPATSYAAPADAPYEAREVTLRTPDGIALAGTLTLPRAASAQRPAPVVITISGSGPQDRDSELAGITGYRIFRELADTLGRRGIGVLRLDDRGVGSSGTGPTTATTADFANDVRAAIAWLRARPGVDGARLGLLGHSEGGIIAPMIAAEDSLVRAVAVLAAPSRPGHELSAHQRRYALAHDSLVAPSARDSVFRVTQAQADSMIRREDGNAWTRFWWSYDPRAALRRVRAPVLVLHGETDRQVPVAQAEEVAALLRDSGNPDVTLRRFPGVNHLFLEDPSGHWDGYATLPSKRVPGAVRGALADWFASRLGVAR